MKFFADENIDRQIVEVLRADGHTVLYVAEMAPGIPDDMVLDSSNRAEAILLTGDKDFGELVFRQKKIASGVVLVRLAGVSPERKAEIISSAIKEHSADFQNSFAVISPGLVRIRRADQIQGNDS
jgi:predicted nuclease of predicted toxin-antitoxin system